MQGIKNLIELAALDPDVKGGLRLRLGKASSGNRYSVVGVWHTMATSYESSSLRLKVRHADRFDFRTGYGETSKEVVLKLKEMTSRLLVSASCHFGLFVQFIKPENWYVQLSFKK